MATEARRRIIAIVTVLALIAFGAGVGAVVGGTLGRSDIPAPQPTDRDAVMAWLARALLVLALAWTVIGMLSARTRLVRRPGAAAARAAWLGATRPWRARESTLGMLRLDLWLLLVVPGALLAATRAVQTSFLDPAQLALIFTAWALFVAVVRLFVGRRSPWPVIATVGGVVVLRCTLTLAALSFTGADGAWSALGTHPLPRTVYISVAVALFLWVFVAAAWALSVQLGARRAIGAVLTGIGAGIAGLAVITRTAGAGTVLSAWVDQLGLLPGAWESMLSQTDPLVIPGTVPWLVAALGLLLAVVGAALATFRRRSQSSSG